MSVKGRSYYKEIGTIAEYAFMTEAMKQGLAISIPAGDNLPYDVVVDNGQKLLKIQIKTAEGYNGIYNIKNRRSQGKKYNLEDFDFACVYIERLNIFYIMPVEEFIGFSGNIRIVEGNYLGNSSKLFDRQNAWKLLKE